MVFCSHLQPPHLNPLSPYFSVSPHNINHAYHDLQFSNRVRTFQCSTKNVFLCSIIGTQGAIYKTSMRHAWKEFQYTTILPYVMSAKKITGFTCKISINFKCSSFKAIFQRGCRSFVSASKGIVGWKFISTKDSRFNYSRLLTVV